MCVCLNWETTQGRNQAAFLCIMRNDVRSNELLWPEQAHGPANNPLHRTGYTQGRAMSIPSAMWFRLGCCGALVRQPVSRERWPARCSLAQAQSNVTNTDSHGILLDKGLKERGSNP
jgi:hypothetical protein